MRKENWKMKKAIVLLPICFLFVAIVPQRATAAFGDIVATFDAPGVSQHGLAWDGTYLWMLDAVGPPYKLFRIDPSDGSTVQEFSIDKQLIGLAYVGGYLWGCESWDDELYKYDLSGNKVAGPYSTPYGAPQGLAYDGTYLWTVYNTADDEITTTTLPPGTDTWTLKFYAPMAAPYGLAWINNYLWVSGGATIYKIDPTDGHVVRILTDGTHFDYTTGITFDDLGYLWVVDNDYDKIYKVDVEEHTYDVTIKAHCYTECVDVSVSIAMDGSPTGYNTPHTFTSLTGTHTFTVPDTDPNGHPFKRWSTGETSTTIAVNTGGTYTAYYEVDEIDVTFGSTPTVDGVISPGEYTDANSMTFKTSGGTCTVYFKHDGTTLFVAFDVPNKDVGSGVQIFVDLDYDRASQPQPDDYRFTISRRSGANEYGENQGTGTGWTAWGPPVGWSGAHQDLATTWNAEFEIPYPKLEITAGVAKTIGIMFYNCWTSTGDYRWPTGGDWLGPSTWGTAYSSDNWGYAVAIQAYCHTEGTPVSVSIAMDGSSTGYNTPHTFTGLAGTHTFTVPDNDTNGHSFKQWSTDETSTTITVTSTGTYTAYYQARFNLTITSTAGGTTNPSPGTHTYWEGTIVSVTAIPDTNYVFDHWKLDGSLRYPNPISVTMDSDHTLHAVFKYSPPPPVGGIVTPVDKFALLAPYIGLSSTILVATATTAIYVKRKKKRQ